MVGIELEQTAKEIRGKLLFEHKVFVGSSSDPNTIRILPPLSIKKSQLDYFVESLKSVLA